MARIAVVEDEVAVAEAVAFTLRRTGHQVEVLDDGRAALASLLALPPDLVVLDLMLPGIDGLEICRRLRARHPETRVVIVTARGEEIDRIVGLESGADDYMVKPFSLRELEARIGVLLRRSERAELAPAPWLHSGGFSLDRERRVLHGGGRIRALAPREAQLLAALMEARGRVVAREELLDTVWGSDFEGESKTLDVHVRWLRQKLEEDSHRPRHLLTVRGSGYRFLP